MRYLPKSPADRAQMMREIGCKSIDDLFAPIPAEYRLTRDLKVPRQMAESEIIDYFHARADHTAAGYALFRPVRRTAIINASADPVEASYIEAFATSMPVNSQIIVWNSKIACNVPCAISG